MLLKKGYSFDIRTFYFLDKSKQKVAYALLQDNLFPVKVACKRAKESTPDNLLRRFDLSALQGGASTNGQGVFK